MSRYLDDIECILEYITIMVFMIVLTGTEVQPRHTYCSGYGCALLVYGILNQEEEP
jgi:hypothetical protein